MSAARPKPKAGLPEAATVYAGGNVEAADAREIERAAVERDGVRRAQRAEAGVWMYSVSLKESRVYCVVGPPGSWPKLLV